MIDLAEPAAPSARARRRSWRTRIVALVGVFLVAAAAVVAVSLHYLRAPGLTTDGGGWMPPDNAHLRSVEAGGYRASVARPRPGRWQTFELEIVNTSSVSQTVLGMTDGATLGDARLVAEPDRLTISTTPTLPQRRTLTFTSKPVVIAPHKVFTLRLSHLSRRDWVPCRSESWNGVSLQVRVGAFTRTENVDLGDLILELRQPGPGC